MEIEEYTTVSGKRYEDFIENVNAMIKDGWQPFGGLSKDFMSCPVQAMVKYRDKTR